jgi:type III pantothenate kinase
MPSLTIDQGNSSAKIAVWKGSELIDEETFQQRLNQSDLERVVRRFAPRKALCCSVTGNGHQLAQWLAADGVDAKELSSQLPLPLVIDYHTPHTLGPDRIAAAVGAWSLFPGESCLVVDMGTAVTYDVVTADGHYLGGNIAPGVGMRLRALRSFTARLPEVNGYGDTPLFGYDTMTAMRAGAVRGVVSEINYYRSLLPEGTHVVLTGGWSKRVSSFLDFPVMLDSCLVTKGLLSILLYNDNL